MNGAEPTRLPADLEPALRESIAVTALRVERWVCGARIVFFGALLVRFLFVGETQPVIRFATLLGLGLGIAFSVAVLLFVRRPPRGGSLWLGSVTLDALVAHCALLPNALWPGPAYIGIVHLPDTTGVLLATVGAGLRLSPPAAAWAGVLNTASLIGLVVVDAAVSGHRFATGAHSITIYLTMLLCGTLIAVLLALTIRRLVSEGASTAVRLERAERTQWTTFTDQHDLRSMLASARLRADLLVEGLPPRTDDAAADGPAASAGLLRENLLRIQFMVEEMRDRAAGDLLETRRTATVALATSLARIAEEMRLRFPAVSLRVEEIPPGATVTVAGGEPSLDRILRNLLQNACEGDGRAGPSTVAVRVENDVELGVTRVSIRDDGPGFADGLPSGTAPVASRKSGGTGVGLSVTRGLLEASAGTLELAAVEPVGSLATFTLPLASRP
ncbi:MAG: HAMP domain-containing histidine kinase [Deltaproteobacteria bacterium]|nr:HAMP domain-containing histidine kinase [Deltaproteobacteria bacterium]